MNLHKILLAVAVMAAVTYLPRIAPLVLFRKDIKSVYIKSFLRYIPFTVLGAMTFPDIFYSTGDILTALSGTVAALVLAFFEKSLVIVALGAIAAAFLAGILF